MVTSSITGRSWRSHNITASIRGPAGRTAPRPRARSSVRSATSGRTSSSRAASAISTISTASSMTGSRPSPTCACTAPRRKLSLRHLPPRGPNVAGRAVRRVAQARAACQPRRARVDRRQLLQRPRPYAPHCRGAAIARCNPHSRSRPNRRRPSRSGRPPANPRRPRASPSGQPIQAASWRLRSPRRPGRRSHPATVARVLPSRRQAACPIGRPAMSIHTQPAAIDSVKKSLVALKMPRALEMLDAALRRVEQGEVTWIEALDQLFIEELTLRDNRRVSTALRMSRLTTVKTLAGFDFAFQPSLDRNRILALAELKFIDRAEVVHLLGPPGTGKSHLATALAVEAVKAGKSVAFATLADIVTALAKAEREGTLRERLRFLARASLLVVDEIGYLPVVPGGGNLFFQLVNARYEKGAMILTSNRGFAEWGEVFGEPMTS